VKSIVNQLESNQVPSMLNSYFIDPSKDFIVIVIVEVEISV